MSTYTRIPNAQDGLVTLLQGRAALDGVTISTGWPGTIEHKHVWVGGDVTGWERTRLASGAVPPEEESFVLRLRLVVLEATDSYTVARDELVELVDEVVQAVRSDVTLGGAVALAHIEGGEFQEFVAADGRGCQVRLDVRCIADL